MNGLQQALAFVIQFREDREFSGRIEHVESGRTANFRSLCELPGILKQMFGEATEGKNPGLAAPSGRRSTTSKT